MVYSAHFDSVWIILFVHLLVLHCVRCYVDRLVFQMENSKLHAYFSQNMAAIHIYVIIKLLAIQAKIGTRLKKNCNKDKIFIGNILGFSIC